MDKAIVIFGVLFGFFLLVLGIILNFFGRIIFPDFWSKEITFLGLLGFLIALMILLNRKKE